MRITNINNLHTNHHYKGLYTSYHYQITKNTRPHSFTNKRISIIHHASETNIRIKKKHQTNTSLLKKEYHKWKINISEKTNDPILYPEDLNPVVGKIMNKEVIYLSEDNTIREAIQLFLSSGISGAPVFNSDKELVGILSETDIIQRESGVIDALKKTCWSSNNIRFEEFSSELPRPWTKKLLEMKVSEIMTKDPLTIDKNTSIIEAAVLMIKNQVNRLLVLNSEGTKVIGILTRGDILQCMIWEILVAGGDSSDDASVDSDEE